MKIVSTLNDEYSIIISEEAHKKMRLYIDLCDTEVGWFGTCAKVEDTFFIEDVFLFKQEVTEVAVDSVIEGLTTLASELLNKPNGTEIYNSLRLYGHSHVRMQCNPSATDMNTQEKTLRDSEAPWFVTVIGNKQGTYRFDINFYDKEVRIEDVDWEIEENDNDALLREQIALELKEKVTRPKFVPTTMWNKDNLSLRNHPLPSYYRNAKGQWAKEELPQDLEPKIINTGVKEGSIHAAEYEKKLAALEEYEDRRSMQIDVPAHPDDDDEYAHEDWAYDSAGNFVGLSQRDRLDEYEDDEEEVDKSVRKRVKKLFGKY